MCTNRRRGGEPEGPVGAKGMDHTGSPSIVFLPGFSSPVGGEDNAAYKET
jgi:hypothetical protein